MKWVDTRPKDMPLSGIRVVDFTTAWAGTRLTAFLGEMGAEVIHVESVQYLDTHRGWSKWAVGASGVFPDNVPGDRPWERNSQYNEFNKNKLGITLNLADPEGVRLFKMLVSTADVVVENYKAGLATRFGVGPKALLEVRPDLIVVSCPGFGTTGPYASYTAWGNQIVAMTGHGLLLNYEGEDEPEPSGTYADPVASILGAFSIVAALMHRDKTGQGQYLELSLSEVLPGTLPEPILDYQLNGRIAQPIGNQNPDAAPWGVYPSEGNDKWVAICCEDDRDFLALAAVMDQPGLPTDPRFATNKDRLAHRVELDELVSAWTRNHANHAISDMLQAEGVAAEPAQEQTEILADQQLRARKFFNPLYHPECGTHEYPLQAIHMSETPPLDYRPAPIYGEHNVQVLGGLLGLTEEKLEELTAAQIIGDEPLEDIERSRA